MVPMGPRAIDRANWDWGEVERNPFWTPDPAAAADWAGYLDELRKSGNSVGAVVGSGRVDRHDAAVRTSRARQRAGARNIGLL